MKRIVLLTSGQPSTNPRLVKEADALSDAGYEVIVFYQHWNDWATKLDRQLLSEKRWVATRVAGDPANDRFIYNLSRLIHKSAKYLFKIFGSKWILPELSISRSTYFLYLKAKTIKADLYLAHNLGALPAAVWAGKHHKKPAGFDAEDFHRFEASDDPKDPDVRLKVFLEEKYLRQLSYLSAASPLIREEYSGLFPGLEIFTVLNTFPIYQREESFPTGPTDKVKFFWFSQTIGPERGLEDIFKVLQGVDRTQWELHLLGDLRPQDQDYFDNLIKGYGLDPTSIIFHAPIASDEIIPFASRFDLGLALETGKPYNREICLTNKVFTYIQAGLGLLASDTKAQVELLNKHPTIGLTFRKGSTEDLKLKIDMLLTDKTRIDEFKHNSFTLGASRLNWEIEKERFLRNIKNLTIDHQ